jgi:hypothetical protein
VASEFLSGRNSSCECTCFAGLICIINLLATRDGYSIVLRDRDLFLLNTEVGTPSTEKLLQKWNTQYTRVYNLEMEVLNDIVPIGTRRSGCSDAVGNDTEEIWSRGSSGDIATF